MGWGMSRCPGSCGHSAHLLRRNIRAPCHRCQAQAKTTSPMTFGAFCPTVVPTTTSSVLQLTGRDSLSDEEKRGIND